MTSSKSTLREYFESIVIAVILALFIRTFVVQAFKIPTGSMENNLLVGDHLLVNKFVFGPAATRARADAAARCAPSGAATSSSSSIPKEPERDFIKRVIGLPGETLELRQKKVYINGKPARRAVRALPAAAAIARPGSAPPSTCASSTARSRCPTSQYFVMGDNRDNSAGQPLLGIPAARLHQGQGADGLLVVSSRIARTTSRKVWARR